MDYEYLKGINSEPQIPTHFPNDNKKRIDYVIAYKYVDDDIDTDKERADFAAKEQMRKKFFDALAKENFHIKLIRFKCNENHVYALLHCDVNRLLDEAERVKLEMRLNNNHFEYEDDEDVLELEGWNTVRNFILRRKPLKKDSHGNILTAPYQSSIKNLFYGCDDKSLKSGPGPFSSKTRSLLVHSILNYINIEPPTKRDMEARKNKQFKITKIHSNNEIGLPFMLNEGYFDDALILHDPTNHYYQLIDIINYSKNLKTNGSAEPNESDTESDAEAIEKITSNASVDADDDRKKLHKTWAKLTNIVRSQPLDLVRGYFGEALTFYFAWTGTFTFLLTIPSVIGLAFFIAGIILSSNKFSTVNVSNSTGIAIASVYGDYYLNIFADSFDNNLTPYFALIISIWGAIFSEFWKRENSRLAFEWDVLKYEADEPDLPGYTREKKLIEEKLKTSSDLVKYFINRSRKLKILFSYFILAIMVCFVGMNIAGLAAFRVYIKKKAYPNSSVLQVVIGDFGSTVINSISILILNNIYRIIGRRLTKWENYRTKTEYDDALIYKLFLFEFANSYGSLFYMAFFRKIEYSNGLFNLGKDFQDKCDNDNCMALLTVQVLVILIINPLPSFFMNVILPLVVLVIKRFKIKYQTDKRIVSERNEQILNEERLRKQNERIVSKTIAIERNKPKSKSTISEEYTQKVILYGYLMLFACSFSLAPLIILAINLIDLRFDGLRLLWLFRRPVGYRAQDIGAWFYIVQFLNIIGIISNAFIIAFTSNWSKSFLQDKLENRLIFVVAFEHVVFLIWIIITYSYSDVPTAVKYKIRQEARLVKEAISKYQNIKPSDGDEKKSKKQAQNVDRVDRNFDRLPQLNRARSHSLKFKDSDAREKETNFNSNQDEFVREYESLANVFKRSKNHNAQIISETIMSARKQTANDQQSLGIIVLPNSVFKEDISESSSGDGDRVDVPNRLKKRSKKSKIRISPLEDK